MSTQMSDALENAWVDHLCGTTSYTAPTGTLYLAILTTTYADGASVVDTTDTNYARQAITFDAAASGATSNSALISFPAAATGWTSASFAIMDHLTATAATNVLFYGTLTDVVGLGEVLEIAAGAIDITMAGGISNFAANEMLDHTLRNEAYSMPTPYVGVMEAWTSTETFTELVDATYARVVPGAMSAAAAGTSDNDADISFAASTDADELFAAGLFDNATKATGNLLLGAALSASKNVGAGEVFRIEAGNLDVTIT